MSKHLFLAGALAIIAVATRLLMPQTVLPGSSAASAWTIVEQATEEPVAPPRSIALPTLKVKAPIVAVGLDGDGAMEDPPYTRAGWYEFGAKPGERGNAVIAGHLDTKTSVDIFWNIKKLQPGDPIVVTDEEGIERTFTVEAVETYAADEAPLQRIFGPSWKRRLNLVTCAGDWGSTGYEGRMVVYAVEG